MMLSDLCHDLWILGPWVFMMVCDLCHRPWILVTVQFMSWSLLGSFLYWRLGLCHGPWVLVMRQVRYVS